MTGRGLSDYLDFGPEKLEGATPLLRYTDSGEPFSGRPARIVYGERGEITYYDRDGRALLPYMSNTFTNEQIEGAEAMTFLREPYRTARTVDNEPIEWPNFKVDIEELKNYIKVEPALITENENNLILKMAEGATEQAKKLIGVNFVTVPKAVEIGIYKTVAYWYENRGETDSIPTEAEKIFLRYRSNPGL